MSDKHNKLEEYIVEGLKPIDKYTRKTPGSGCGHSNGDISNGFFYVEAKQKHSKTNIVIDYKNEWLTLNSRIPLNSTKIPIIVTENRHGDKFCTLDLDDFFDLAKKAFEGED